MFLAFVVVSAITLVGCCPTSAGMLLLAMALARNNGAAAGN